MANTHVIAKSVLSNVDGIPAENLQLFNRLGITQEAITRWISASRAITGSGSTRDGPLRLSAVWVEPGLGSVTGVVTRHYGVAALF